MWSVEQPGDAEPYQQKKWRMRTLVCARGFDRHFFAGHQCRYPLRLIPRPLYLDHQDFASLFFPTARKATSYQGRGKLGSARNQLCAVTGSSAPRAHAICWIRSPEPLFCQQSLLPSASVLFSVFLVVSSRKLSRPRFDSVHPLYV